jgi:hypothetical protein
MSQPTLDERVQALLADPATTIPTLVGCLKTVDDKVDELTAAAKPYKKASDALRGGILERLAAGQLKSLKVEGLGTVTRTELEAFKMQDAPSFWQWLDEQRATIGTEVYSYFGATLSKPMLSDVLLRTGSLPTGIAVTKVASLRFTAIKES